MSRNFGVPRRNVTVVDLDPTESPAPHRRVLTSTIDPTEFSREEYDQRLRKEGINPEPWVKYPD